MAGYARFIARAASNREAQQAEEVCGSIWGGAALPNPVNEWVLDPAFVHGCLTCVCL